jgi:hypothetical protein
VRALLEPPNQRREEFEPSRFVREGPTSSLRGELARRERNGENEDVKAGKDCVRTRWKLEPRVDAKVADGLSGDDGGERYSLGIGSSSESLSDKSACADSLVVRRWGRFGSPEIARALASPNAGVEVPLADGEIPFRTCLLRFANPRSTSDSMGICLLVGPPLADNCGDPGSSDVIRSLRIACRTSERPRRMLR